MLPYLVAVAVALAISLAMWFSADRAARRSGSDLPPDREDIAYRPFTTEYDVVCTGAQLQSVIARSGKDVRPGKLFDPYAKDRRFAEYAEHHRSAAESMGKVELPDLTDWAVLVLIDQSGSLADRLACIAGAVRACAERFEGGGARVMIAGFTTLGWHGGEARKAWSRQGRPAYPGRLCDLLHIVYSPFERSVEQGDLIPLFNVGAAFENVDGEALRWAADEIGKEQAARKAILVVSDGAPVDDSTLMENGATYMERDIRSAIAMLEADPLIALGSIGIDFDVGRYYSNSSTAATVEHLPGELARLLASFAA